MIRLHAAPYPSRGRSLRSALSPVRPVSSRRRLGALVAVGLTSTLLSLSACGSQPQPPPGGASPPAALPARQAAKIHSSLHKLARLCRQRNRQGTEAEGLRHEVVRFITFSRRFPTARFQIHDESGTMLSALLVVREELSSCDPALVREVEPAIERLNDDGLAEP